MIKLSLLTLLLALSLLSAAAERGSEAVSPKHTRDSVSVRTAINAGYKIHAHRTTGNIHLDGIPDEPDWKRAETAGNFYMVLPYDTGHCKARSEIRLTYDDKAFYLALVFHDTVPGKRPVESLRRDFVFGNNDNFLLFIDPFNDQTTGYSFGVNAAGALWDGTMSGGSAVNLVWDCKWDVKVRNDSDRWCAEMRIPFKSIRYKSGIDHWNIQFSRLDLKLNEKSAWAPVPRQFPTASLAYAGQLIWDTPPPRSGIHLSLIPSIFGSISRNFETGDATHYKRNFGLDAKLGLSTALNLDLTYHPDFSQAEVDDQVINLDRFELYFPEKRQFFLENSDLFANFGNAQVRPFFSRRIGLDAPVDFGARLSGKMGQDWRIGMMDMQTAEEAGLPSRNFYVASVQKKLFSRSNIAAIFVNKQPLHLSGDARTIDYNRLAGLEYNLATSDNFLNAKFFGQKSFTPQSNSAEEYSEGVSLTYSRKSYLLEMNQLYVGRDFNAETGYVPRTNYLRTDPKVTLKFYPKSGSIENQGIYLEADDYYHPEKMRLTDRNITLDGYINFKSRVHIEAKGSAKFVELGQDFDPSHEGNHHLLKGSSYRWKEFTLLFNSDNRRPFKYDLQAGAGGYFNGSGYYLSGDFIWKFQPFGYLSLLYNFTHLNLPQPWTNQNYWLLGPKVDVTFTNNLFFTTYVQYNKQTDNLNINARFQWRYKPVSDLFLVYTDNYFPDNFHAKNRAVVLKLTYWFN